MRRKKSTLKKYRIKSKIKSKKYKRTKKTTKVRKIRKSRKVRKSRKNKMKGAGLGSSCEACNQGDANIIPKVISEPKKSNLVSKDNDTNEDSDEDSDEYSDEDPDRYLYDEMTEEQIKAAVDKNMVRLGFKP